MSAETNNTNTMNILIQQVGKLAESVDKLVVLDAKREERDKHQEEINLRYMRFMDESREVINTSRRWQGITTKAVVPLIVTVVLTVSAAIKFDLMK